MFQKFKKSEHDIYSFIFTHMKMKKLLLGAFLGIFALAGITTLPNYVNAEEPEEEETETTSEYEDTNEWSKPKADTNMVGGSQTLVWATLLDTIKNAINWILWILATIALVICLYGWFKMVTAAGDEKKYGEWLKVLKYAAIGLAIIGLSWMIVSVIFWFIGTLWWWNQTQKWAIGGGNNVWDLNQWGVAGE